MVPSGAGVSSSAGKPLELCLAQLAVVVARDRGVHGDDAQAVDEVAVVHRCVVAGLVEQPGPEVGPVVVVSHGPDDLGAHAFARWLHDGPQFCVGLGIALVSEVAGEDHGLGPAHRKP